MSGKYDDIRTLEWKSSLHRPKMDMEDRAKIFLPFSALKGFEEKIEEKKHIYVPMTELSEEKKEDLDRKVQYLLQKLKEDEHPMVTAVYYGKHPESGRGVYLQYTGLLSKIDVDNSILQIVNERIPFSDLNSLEGEVFWKMEDEMES